MPNGPMIPRLKMTGATPEIVFQAAMVESDKFRRWPPVNRARVLEKPEFLQIAMGALDQLDFRRKRARVKLCKRHTIRYPSQGMNISKIAEHINQAFWKDGWAVAVGLQETRILVRENLNERYAEGRFVVPDVAKAPKTRNFYDDLSDASRVIVKTDVH